MHSSDELSPLEYHLLFLDISGGFDLILPPPLPGRQESIVETNYSCDSTWEATHNSFTSIVNEYSPEWIIVCHSPMLLFFTSFVSIKTSERKSRKRLYEILKIFKSYIK